jgi:hypothetical protein
MAKEYIILRDVYPYPHPTASWGCASKPIKDLTIEDLTNLAPILINKGNNTKVKEGYFATQAFEIIMADAESKGLFETKILL